MEYWVCLATSFNFLQFNSICFDYIIQRVNILLYELFPELPSWYKNRSSTESKKSSLEEFKRYRLRNSLGYEVDVLSLGATITAIKVSICSTYF